MKPKITKKQLLSITKLLGNLKKFTDLGYGSIEELIIMTYNADSNTIYVKYEKTFTSSGEMAFEYKIASIDSKGEIDFIDHKFKDMFERAAFLSECKAFDIRNENEYDKID